jgi:hypothetical protein
MGDRRGSPCRIESSCDSTERSRRDEPSSVNHELGEVHGVHPSLTGLEKAGFLVSFERTTHDGVIQEELLGQVSE